MATWCFKTAARHTRDTQTQQWYWQLDEGYSFLLTSMRLFPSLEECVRDAQAKGFQGALHVPPLLTYPVTLGKGKRLFGDGTPAGALTMTDHKVTSAGTVIATYEPTGAMPEGTFATPEPATSAREAERQAKMKDGSW